MEKAQPRHWGVIAVLLAIAAGPSQAAAPYPDAREFAIAPYLWFPNVSGALRFSGSSSTGGGILDVGTGLASHLQNLQFLFMLQAEASKGSWTVFADAIYLDFSQQQTNLKSVSSGNGASVFVPRDLATDASSGMSGALFQLAAGCYKAVRAPGGTVEPFGGLPVPEPQCACELDAVCHVHGLMAWTAIDGTPLFLAILVDRQRA